MSDCDNYIVQDGFFPSDEPELFCRCADCDEEIYVGDDYYDLGDFLCEDCAKEWLSKQKKTAERMGM